MATIRHIDAFDEAIEQWTTYIERFDHFTKANDIDEEKRVPMLLSVMGTKTYGLLRTLVAPAKPGEKTCQQGENVSQYVAVLKQLSEHCDFGTHLEDALRDRFVCGLNNEAIQKRLLTESALTFHKAVEIALAAETVAREAKQLSSSLKVNALHVSSPKQQRNCKRCGKTNHTEEDCWYKDQACHSCGKKGHIGRVCRNKQNFERERKCQSKFKPCKRCGKDDKRRVHHLDTGGNQSGESSADTEKEVSLYMVTRSEQLAHICITPEIERKMIEMELDTGAAVSLISKEKYDSNLL